MALRSRFFYSVVIVTINTYIPKLIEFVTFWNLVFGTSFETKL